MSFDPRRLDIYRLSLRLSARVHELTEAFPRGETLRDQLRRSAQSVFLNLSEGLGHPSKGVKRRAFSVSQGELAETRAALDLAFAQGLIERGDFDGCEETADRIAAMLWRLVRTLNPR